MASKEKIVPITGNFIDTLHTVGLVAFQNEKNYLLIGKRLNKDKKEDIFVKKSNTSLNESQPTIIAR
ncbi:hypothetical protein [Mariniflexile sp. HMF6888]|uniref:hypothetical protein n=1 Tax=Mariniflexile sp. HMF6888 TaxID=3373086 RepID=UPI0037A634C1